ncbi:STAS domain-containing protein [Hymenobacter sp. RP-2-7]|uniref:Anti-sigma factor antagonist n=1 Tax=Hymenobacter polaris TaxID=2682546 RepID=A0A7Y0FLD8_9BACT|nr:STAS domain-containing protein [Hymenobacter polaris]NML64395.1 STAS domain-containing protein [Hymenobacter polaris]
MTATTSTVEDITVVTAEGSIDSKTAGEFERTALTAIQGQREVIIDLTQVDFLSSAGLRVLLVVYRQLKAKNGQVVLVGTSEDIKDVMSDTGFLSFFSTVDTLAQGLALLQAK